MAHMDIRVRASVGAPAISVSLEFDVDPERAGDVEFGLAGETRKFERGDPATARVLAAVRTLESAAYDLERYHREA